MTIAGLPYTEQLNPIPGLPQEENIPGWKDIAQSRRDEINRAIPESFLVPPKLLEGTNHVNLARKSGIFTARELGILQLSATKLLERIHNQVLTSVEVATAFCKSAAIAHQAVCTPESSRQ